MNSKRYAALLSTTFALVVAACGDITGGLDSGEVRALAIGDGAAPSAALGPAGLPHGASAAAARGTISFSATVTLMGTTGEPVSLTTTPVTATVRIEGSDIATLAIRRVPVGNYSSVRVVFSNASANVESGLLVNGTPFLGPLTVAGTATVVAPVQLVVEPTFSTTLLIDLRSSAWLPATDLLSRSVTAATVQSAVQVSLQ